MLHMRILRVLDMVVGGHGLVSPGDLLLGDVAEASSVLVRLFVVDEKLSVLAVATGLFACDAYEVEDRRCLVEDGVHLLKRAICGFGVEEVHDGEDHKVAIESDAQLVLVIPTAVSRHTQTYITAKMI